MNIPRTNAMLFGEVENLIFIERVSDAVEGTTTLDNAELEKLIIVSSTTSLWYACTFEGRDCNKIPSNSIPLLANIYRIVGELRPKAIELIKQSIWYSDDRWPRNDRLVATLELKYDGGGGSIRDWVDRNSNPDF